MQKSATKFPLTLPVSITIGYALRHKPKDLPVHEFGPRSKILMTLNWPVSQTPWRKNCWPILVKIDAAHKAIIEASTKKTTLAASGETTEKEGKQRDTVRAIFNDLSVSDRERLLDEFINENPVIARKTKTELSVEGWKNTSSNGKLFVTAPTPEGVGFPLRWLLPAQ